MNLPSSLTFRWLWFGVAVAAGHAWAYGSRLMPSLLPPCLHWFWPRRQFLYFLLYTLLLGGSISVTGPGEMLKRQMAHLAGLHFALFLIVGLGSGYIASAYADPSERRNGPPCYCFYCLMILTNRSIPRTHTIPTVLKQFGIRPFLLSCLLVVTNDICAYRTWLALFPSYVLGPCP